MTSTTHLLMLHGNGGGEARFALLRRYVQHDGFPARLHFPDLPGFDGRPLPAGKPADWATFLDPLRQTVAAFPDARWVLYGHGIGGSLLLEWARRGFDLEADRSFSPARVILHGCIGASLEHRLFPRLMQPRWSRRLLQRAISWPPLRPLFERRLFQHPERIPKAMRRRFFADYGRCAAFPVFFDLITPSWYRQVPGQVSGEGLVFLWGERERVVAANYLDLWRKDFPEAHFELVPDWDHFPMLDHAEAFMDRLQDLLEDSYAEN